MFKGKQFLGLSPDRELWAEAGPVGGGGDDGPEEAEAIEAILWPLAAAKGRPVCLELWVDACYQHWQLLMWLCGSDDV